MAGRGDGRIRNLPGPPDAFLQHRGLGIVPRNELAVADLPGAQVNELDGLPQVQACAGRQGALRFGQHRVDERAHLVQLQARGVLQRFDHARGNVVFGHDPISLPQLLWHQAARRMTGMAAMFHGSSSSMRLIGCSAMRVSTSRR
jgi:hypothetical protein